MEIVNEEIARLHEMWADPDAGDAAREARQAQELSLVARALGLERSARLDRFDRVQLEDVLQACRDARTLSDAGRLLFSVSRTAKRSSNDADRLRKYLARFDLDWARVSALGR